MKLVRSLSLTCITHTRNQTTLGLAVKLQHRYGSSELIRLLHDHGFIVSYDEVIRFRKSAAKFLVTVTGITFCIKPWV